MGMLIGTVHGVEGFYHPLPLHGGRTYSVEEFQGQSSEIGNIQRENERFIRAATFLGRK
jgi:hypothetical protein